MLCKSSVLSNDRKICVQKPVQIGFTTSRIITNYFILKTIIAILSKVTKVKSSTTDISLNFRLLVNLITCFKQIPPNIKWSKSSFDLYN